MEELKRFRQFLAEGEIKEYIKDAKYKPITQNDWPLEAFGFETTLYDDESPEGEDIRVMFDTLEDFGSDEEAKKLFDKLFDPSSNAMWEEFIEREAKELGMDINYKFEDIRPVTFAR